MTELARRLAAAEEAFRLAQQGNDARAYREALVALWAVEAEAIAVIHAVQPEAA